MQLFQKKIMLQNYELKKAKIGSFNGICAGEYATINSFGKSVKVGMIEINENSLKEIICVIDEENQNAIDIFTGNFYHILKRDANNRIVEDVQADCYYVLRIYDEKKITDSMLHRIYCNHLAEQAVSSYKKNIGEKVKIKKKTK